MGLLARFKEFDANKHFHSHDVPQAYCSTPCSWFICHSQTREDATEYNLKSLKMSEWSPILTFFLKKKPVFNNWAKVVRLSLSLTRFSQGLLGHELATFCPQLVSVSNSSQLPLGLPVTPLLDQIGCLLKATEPREHSFTFWRDNWNICVACCQPHECQMNIVSSFMTVSVVLILLVTLLFILSSCL